MDSLSSLAQRTVPAWLGVLLTACASTSPPGDMEPVPSTHVGGQICAGCHAAEYDSWQGSHHDLAMQEATEESVTGDFDNATFEYAGVRSTFFVRGEKFLVRTDGPDGEPAEYEIAYTFGVTPLQQYLIEFPDGRLQALSICWDTRAAGKGGQRWFHLYPDERIDHRDVLHWTGPLQNWNFMCAECHSTRLRKNYRPEEDRFESSWSEIDVSCEACHGPGSGHVAWAEAAASGESSTLSNLGLAVRLAETDDARWIMDPEAGVARRSRPRRSVAELETCARCHSRRAILSEAYVHGNPLVDTHRPALLTEELYHADGQILDEVYVYGSFLQSKMHAAGVTCTDCHDPHSLELNGSGNGLCAPCHLATRFDTPEHHHHEPEAPGAECVQCHMPSRNYMVVDPRRDHGFRVPRPDLTVKIGTPNACNGCHEGESAEWAAEQAVAWWGPDRSGTPHYGETIHAGRRGLAGAGAALGVLAGDPGAPGIVRATALSLMLDNPGPAVLPAVRRGVGDQDPLVRLAAADVAEMLDPASRVRLLSPLLRDPFRTVRIEAASGLAPVPPGTMSQDQHLALEAALGEYREAQEFNADRMESHLNLGLLHAQLGDLDQAEVEYRKAISMMPAFAAAYVNLADLYRLRQQEEAAEKTLREGLAAGPDSSDLYHALGLTLVRQKRHQEGIEALRRAHELDPDSARYAYVFGVALSSAGDRGEAVRVLAGAHQRRPGDREILVALATISRDAGQRERAIAYAEKLVRLSPGDPDARRLLAELRR